MRENLVVLQLLLQLATAGCPAYEERGWRLVRRSTGAYHQATDNLALTDSYGTPHKYPLGDSFSLDTSGIKFDLVLFTLGDCSKWVKMRFSEVHADPMSFFPLTRHVIEQYDSAGAVGVIKMMPQNLGTMKTDIYSFYDMSDVQCALLYTEDAAAVCNGGSMDAEEHGGMNVWVRDSEWSLDNCHLSPSTMDYNDVEIYCNDIDMLPLTINTPEQLNELTTSGCSQGNSVWAGLSDDATELSWVNNFGEMINPGFMTANMDGFSSQNCMDVDSGGTMDDQACSSMRHAVCIEGWELSPRAAPPTECDQASCRIVGDPHVLTFDNNKNDIYVDGQLKLVMTEKNAPVPYLKIETETRVVDPVPMSARSGLDTSLYATYVYAVLVDFYSPDGRVVYSVKMNEYGDAAIRVNGGTMMPLAPRANEAFSYTAQLVTDDTTYGEGDYVHHQLNVWSSVRVELFVGKDKNPTVWITLGKAYQDQIKGLCGNWNCVFDDDYQLNDGTRCVDDTMFALNTAMPNWGATVFDRSDCEFSSQLSYLSNPEIARVGTKLPSVTCDESLMTQCDTMFDGFNFVICSAIVDENALIENCVTDICNVQNNPDAVSKVLQENQQHLIDHCVYMQRVFSLATDACAVDLGQDCPSNMHYVQCAECSDRLTCADFLNGRVCSSDPNTFAGCVCDANFYLDEFGQCIPEADCAHPQIELTAWSAFGPCSVTCGGGSFARTRFCVGGEGCVGNMVQLFEQSCNTQPCVQELKCSSVSSNCAGFIDTDFVDAADGTVKTVSIDSTDPADPTLVIDGTRSNTFDTDANTAEFDGPDFTTFTASINTANTEIKTNHGLLLTRLDVDECVDAGLNDCQAPDICANTAGSFVCNCVVDDRDDNDCVTYQSSTEEGWTDSTFDASYAHCQALAGSRLMRVTSVAELETLFTIDSSKFAGHVVNVRDLVTEGTWLSYMSPVSFGVWSGGSVPGGDDTINCAALTVESAAYMLTAVDCTLANPFVCETLDLSTTCDQWLDRHDQPVFVDQEMGDSSDGGSSDLISIVDTFGKAYIGTLDGNVITMPDDGLGDEPWTGLIYKTDPNTCIQEYLDEYCRNLGVTDDVLVWGESQACENRNYARFDSSIWSCHRSVSTSTTSISCVDNDGDVVVDCAAADTTSDTGDGQPACASSTVANELQRKVDYFVEHGCKR